MSQNILMEQFWLMSRTILKTVTIVLAHVSNYFNRTVSDSSPDGIYMRTAVSWWERYNNNSQIPPEYTRVSGFPPENCRVPSLIWHIAVLYQIAKNNADKVSFNVYSFFCIYRKLLSQYWITMMSGKNIITVFNNHEFHGET